jgi:hypothetical protein
MKVWIVTGEICCCGIEILGVFSTKWKAMDFIDSDEKYKGAEADEYEVE